MGSPQSAQQASCDKLLSASPNPRRCLWQDNSLVIRGSACVQEIFRWFRERGLALVGSKTLTATTIHCSSWLGDIVGQQLLYPTAPGPIQHRFPLAVFESCAYAKRK